MDPLHLINPEGRRTFPGWRQREEPETWSVSGTHVAAAANAEGVERPRPPGNSQSSAETRSQVLPTTGQPGHRCSPAFPEGTQLPQQPDVS